MKYKVGDKVRIKSLDWYKEQDGLIPSWLCPCCGRVMTITVAYIQGYAVEEVQGVLFKDFMIEGLADVSAISPDAEGWINEFACPDGYEFRDENGNVISTTKIVLEKKKKEYPKTYGECCKVLNVAVRDLDILDNMLDTTEIIYNKNLDRLLNSFRKLLICRDAYWKIAGEEMGLGKPWEPDWTDLDQWKYCIWVDVGEFITMTNVRGQHILAFPTEEMRDAFKENFDPDIEICKEFL
jgi:hypothetical protein